MRVDPGPSRWDFPPPQDWAADEDVVAIGADLEPSTVLAAYRAGLFPMHLDGDLAWWSPDPRGVLPLDGLRVTRSLAKSCRHYAITVDRAFDDVMRACADPGREGRWINDEITDAYTELHQMGWAHSVEAWEPDGSLAGGLYGIEVGGLFAGESMFHLGRDASKAALVGLVELLRAAGGPRVLDVQWRTEHLATLGVVEVPRTAYLAQLARALPLEPAL